MRPLTIDQVAKLESLLLMDGSGTATRDRALLRVGIDSMLRSSDVLAVTLRDIAPNGELSAVFSVRQKKTKRVIRCEMNGKTLEALDAWLAINPDMTPDDRIFAISTRQHQRIVKDWCKLLSLDGVLYSTHSIRRTKPAYIYAQTKDIAALQQLLGHHSPANTSEYLGVENADARELARKYQI
jgi:integrase